MEPGVSGGWSGSVTDLIFQPNFLLIAVPAILAVGLSKGGLTPLGGLAVPLLAFSVPPSVAAGIVLPLLCLSDLFAMWAYRKYCDHRILLPLAGAAAPGVLLGYLSFGVMNEATIGLSIGVISILFTLRYWLRNVIPSGEGGKAPSLNAGFAWSAVSGYTSFVAHAGGPPLMFYLLPLKLDRMIFSGTSIFFFGVVNLMKLPPYARLGLLKADNLVASLVLAPAAVIGVLLGNRLIKSMGDTLFYRLGYWGTFLAGLKLAWDGAIALFS